MCRVVGSRPQKGQPVEELIQQGRCWAAATGNEIVPYRAESWVGADSTPPPCPPIKAEHQRPAGSFASGLACFLRDVCT